MSNRCAVIGNPIDHSLSPLIHQQFATQAGMELTYEKILGDPAHFETQVARFFAAEGRGVNITLPFKTRAFAMSAITTKRCAKARAANTLWMQKGQLYADNTDGVGLIRDLAHHIVLHGKTVLVSGAGGAARGIISPLLDSGVTLVLVNRSMEKAYGLQNDFPEISCLSMEALTPEFDMIINATSASLLEDQREWPENLFQNQPLCYDLAYRAGENTAFVEYARQHGCIAVDGLGMLVEQAAEAFSIWHNFAPETATVLRHLRQL